MTERRLSQDELMQLMEFVAKRADLARRCQIVAALFELCEFRDGAAVGVSEQRVREIVDEQFKVWLARFNEQRQEIRHEIRIEPLDFSKGWDCSQR